jgi:hypothetical protein
VIHSPAGPQIRKAVLTVSDSPTEPKLVRCRYLGRRGIQCTAEVVDPNGEIALCTKHLGRALELLKRYGANTADPS